MKLTKFNTEQLSIFESALDDLIAQNNTQTAQNQTAPVGPSKMKRASDAVRSASTTVGTGITNAATNLTRVGTNAAKNTANAVTDVLSTPSFSSPGSSGSWKNVDLFSKSGKTNYAPAPSFFAGEKPSRDMIDAAKQITKGKVAKRGTDSPEVDKLLKQLKVLK